MAYQVFVSHTQKDKTFCDWFDTVCARLPIIAFRSEFETIEYPPWQTIRDAMRKSIAMFLLVGPELTASQASQDPQEREKWKYTQNWIAYEIGLACQLGIDVWVLCDQGVEVNFPVPYFNNYALVSSDTKANFNVTRSKIKAYSEGKTYAFPHGNLSTKCTYEDCSIEFNFHSKLSAGKKIKCPQCLNDIVFPKGFPT